SGATVSSGGVEISMVKALLRAAGDYDEEDLYIDSEFDAWAAAEAVWPEWAEEEQPAVLDEDFKTMYRNISRSAYASHEGMKTGVKQLRYLVHHYPDEPLRDYVWLAMARLLERLREDHLAYKEIKAIQETGKISVPWSEEHVLYFADHWHDILANIFARNGFTDQMEAEIAALDTFLVSGNGHGPGDHLSNIVKAYFTAGMNDKVIERLGKLTDESTYEHKTSMASTTVGAASMLFRMGEYEKVLEMTQWMMDEGLESTRFIKDPENSYYVDKWQSSFKQVEEWRTLAQNGLTPSFRNLVDGNYEAEAQGFRDKIGISAVVADGRLKEVLVGPDHMEDRPITAFTIIPKTWVERRSLAVDGISGATVTSGAVEAAIIKTLIQAKAD
ncbi:MAG: hypothetical protein CSB33_05255, partial [Desulfobacterales bacterium]